MKYGAFYSKSRTNNNVGDSIIDLALLNIYKAMGIEDKNIIRISPRDLASYDGEEMLMPIVSPLPSHPFVSKAFSNKITPLFICFVLYGPLNSRDREYLKRYEPIGCRDEYTYNELTKNNVSAYINGCITVTYPKLTNLEKEKTDRKVILTDVQPELLKYIPKNLLIGSQSVSHTKTAEINKDPLDDAKSYLDFYRQHASLVITSRLHVASPCLAMGIPCVFAKNEFSHRFSWIDRYINVYDQSEYQNINWQPTTLDIESIKKDVFELVSARISNSDDCTALQKKLTEFYLGRKKKECVTSLSKVIPLLNQKLESGKIKTYSLWSLTSVSLDIYTYISTRFPNVKLIHVYDKNRVEEFCGLISEPIDCIKKADEDLLIACPFNETVMQQMSDFLENLNFNKDKYLLAYPEP